MRSFRISIEKNGEQIPVGQIGEDASGDISFAYAPEYIYARDAAAISLSLPLREAAYGSRETRIFFEGLLPEGFTRRSVAGWLRADEDDYLSILAGLGRECLGAVRITAEGDEPEKASYEKLSLSRVRALAKEGATRSAELVTRAHLSLTGASGKVGLYLDKDSGSWYLPRGSAPSTHIVKQSHIRLDGIVTNEQLCMMTARRLGLPVPESFIVNTAESGEPGEGDVLYASVRFDRELLPDAPRLEGLACPTRLHQEDFSQALGIASAKKYESAGDGYLKAMFGLLRRYSANPIEDQLKLWDALVFDYLIGNADNHVKNFSLLYAADLKSLRLAPLYDVVSTSVYDSSTRDMAIYIGGECSLDRLGREAFRRAAREIGLGERLALEHFDRMSRDFKAALSEAAKELADNGFVLAEQLEKRVLASGGIRNAWA